MKINYKILLGIVFIFFLSSNVYAAQYYTVPNGGNTNINEHGTNKNVANACGYGLFVPTNTAAEWITYFLANKPACVTITNPPPNINDLLDNLNSAYTNSNFPYFRDDNWNYYYYYDVTTAYLGSGCANYYNGYFYNTEFYLPTFSAISDSDLQYLFDNYYVYLIIEDYNHGYYEDLYLEFDGDQIYFSDSYSRSLTISESPVNHYDFDYLGNEEYYYWNIQIYFRANPKGGGSSISSEYSQNYGGIFKRCMGEY
jgi:hypothetical protein